jgi:hypothetical protein
VSRPVRDSQHQAANARGLIDNVDDLGDMPVQSPE